MKDKLRISPFYLQHSLNIHKAFVLSKKSKSTAYSYLYFLTLAITFKHQRLYFLRFVYYINRNGAMIWYTIPSHA